VALAVHRYRTDPELTLAQAAAIARVSVESMKEILKRYGVPLRLGPTDRTEALAKIRALKDSLNAGSC
jgi:predicted HTH domain antitoxin